MLYGRPMAGLAGMFHEVAALPDVLPASWSCSTLEPIAR